MIQSRFNKKSLTKAQFLVGIDEAGRGPLAGPVAVAAFAVPIELQHLLLKLFPGGRIRDSKKLSPKRREEIFKRLKQAKFRGEISLAVSFGSAALIDRKGLAFAVRQTLAQSLTKLCIKPSEALVLLDGSLKAPKKFKNQRTIIKGDEKEAVIALASIVAKVSRDRKMRLFAEKYSGYGFEVHKGYGTEAHYRALKRKGLCPIHRKSFLAKLFK